MESAAGHDQFTFDSLSRAQRIEATVAFVRYVCLLLHFASLDPLIDLMGLDRQGRDDPLQLDIRRRHDCIFEREPSLWFLLKCGLERSALSMLTAVIAGRAFDRDTRRNRARRRWASPQPRHASLLHIFLRAMVIHEKRIHPAWHVHLLTMPLPLPLTPSRS